MKNRQFLNQLTITIAVTSHKAFQTFEQKKFFNYQELLFVAYTICCDTGVIVIKFRRK